MDCDRIYITAVGKIPKKKGVVPTIGMGLKVGSMNEDGENLSHPTWDRTWEDIEYHCSDNDDCDNALTGDGSESEEDHDTKPKFMNKIERDECPNRKVTSHHSQCRCYSLSGHVA